MAPPRRRQLALRIARRLGRFAGRLVKAAVCLAVVGGVVLAVAWAAFPFPRERLRPRPASPTVLDVRGREMLRLVAADGHWHRPVPLERISPWLIRATVAVEDRRFWRHPGVDPLAAARAAVQNLAAGRIVSGASTLDMQICRMMGGRPRTFRAKTVESFRALQLNALKTKREILELYLNLAPYGRNCRGVEAASRAYFGRDAGELSLAEAALLAGLPQSPSRLRPDRHPRAARRRQRLVLAQMAAEGLITDRQRREAQADPIVLRGAAAPRRATHAAWLALKQRPTGGRTTIDLDVQQQVERLAAEHARRLPDGAEQAVVVIDIAASAIRALVGSGDVTDPVDGQVNGALARRSPGSALKPFLYAAAFEAGRLNAASIVHDVPIQRGGWAPGNFDRTFSGEVTAAEALRRSLNVPAILVAEGVGLARCCGVLEAAGVRLPADAQRRGGLALAVGGIEVTLLDLTNAYATLGRRGVRMRPRLFADEPRQAAGALGADVCAAVDEILSSRRRRPRGAEGLRRQDVPWFMWKTGTSAARRDAWAVGHNGRFAVGVWVGRFRGTGRVAFVGAEAAEPLLARLFDLPALRRRGAPSPARPIVVRRPLPVPAEAADVPRILAPSRGETFLALGGRAVIRTRTNRLGGLTWFLDGRLIDARRAARLELPPGSYELRCVGPAGRSSNAVRFVIRPTGATRGGSSEG